MNHFFQPQFPLIDSKKNRQRRWKEKPEDKSLFSQRMKFYNLKKHDDWSWLVEALDGGKDGVKAEQQSLVAPPPLKMEGDGKGTIHGIILAILLKNKVLRIFFEDFPTNTSLDFQQWEDDEAAATHLPPTLLPWSINQQNTRWHNAIMCH